jgi:(S)-citramalyl-CoA lyase
VNSSLRSALFTPATRPERFAKAAEVNADLLIIDLEDAVAPGDKDAERAKALDALSHPSGGAMKRALRINAMEKITGLTDTLALLKQGGGQPDYVVVPKTESATHLQLLDRVLTEAGCQSRLIAIIESSRALQALEQIASATPRLAALMLGAADLAADLGCGSDAPNLVLARALMIQACALNDIAAIDSPYFDIHDEDGLQRDTERAADMGFTGKAAIHPAQIAAINRVFTPTAEAVAHARAVLIENRKGVGQVDGQMVDEAVARKARRVLAAVGETPPNN